MAESSNLESIPGLVQEYESMMRGRKGGRRIRCLATMHTRRCALGSLKPGLDDSQLLDSLC